MDKLFFSAIIGLVAGVIDIIPMIMQKLPRYSTVSAFFHYFFVSIIILNALTIPMLIQVGHSDKKSLPIIAFNAILLGTLVGLAGHYISVF